jgi:ATPase subunit of ABC transporter with duplicated ATPase domains
VAAHEPVSLSARNLSVDRSGHRVLNGVNLTITDRSRMAVVGPNGIGKSTLLAALAGEIEPTSGAVDLSPSRARVGLLDQELERSHQVSARQLIAAKVGVAAAKSEFDTATVDLAVGRAGADERYDQALTAWESAGGFDFDHRVDALALELGLQPSVIDRATATLSGGQLTKVGLLAVMASRFDVTLLDEPTNNLDRDGLALLETWVLSQPRALVMVSHDRRFLERTVISVARIDEHHRNVTVFTGGWADYQQQAALARRQAEDRYNAYREERQRLQQLSQKKREWADRGTSRVKKRPADNDRNRRSHELAAAEGQIGAAKKVANRLRQLEEVERPWQPWELHYSIAEAERGSSEVVTADRLVLQRGSFVLGPVSLTIGWGERILVDGPNGSGKSTLVLGLLGELSPVGGTVRMGPSIKPGTVGQLRTKFDSDRRLLDLFVDESGLDPTVARSLLAKFDLDATVAVRPTTTLSPGQRTRAELAVFQARGVNFIVLDEPTNHLDIEAIEQLEQALTDFGGTLLVVSHDRRFRENIDVTRIVDVTELRAYST